jgi:prevent-host-death family protein
MEEPMIVNVHAAKTNLSKLIERACAGEEVVIARDNEPMVRLVPMNKPEPKREFGSMKGELNIPDEFFGPLPDDELELWEQ